MALFLPMCGIMTGTDFPLCSMCLASNIPYPMRKAKFF